MVRAVHTLDLVLWHALLLRLGGCIDSIHRLLFHLFHRQYSEGLQDHLLTDFIVMRLVELDVHEV